MTDETLVAQLKEVGAHFCQLQEQADERGLEVRIVQMYYPHSYKSKKEITSGPKYIVEVRKLV
jgi:hypothetical protein